MFTCQPSLQGIGKPVEKLFTDRFWILTGICFFAFSDIIYALEVKNGFLQSGLAARSKDGISLDGMVAQSGRTRYQWMGCFSKLWIPGKGWMVDRFSQF